jgi:hypothetical protein
MKKSLNTDGQQCQKYQQNEPSPQLIEHKNLWQMMLRKSMSSLLTFALKSREREVKSPCFYYVSPGHVTVCGLSEWKQICAGFISFIYESEETSENRSKF